VEGVAEAGAWWGGGAKGSPARLGMGGEGEEVGTVRQL
jgi:hypothetical protein